MPSVLASWGNCECYCRGVSEIERQYRSELGAWSGQQRVPRSAGLFMEMTSVLARKVALSDPGLDERGVQIRVAESLYRTDPEIQRLLADLDR